MAHPSRSFVAAALAASTGLIGGPTSARADIAGFGDFSGFSINKLDSASNSPIDIPGGSIHLTLTDTNQGRSIFAKIRQNITAFTATFTYKALSTADLSGACFVIQNDPRGDLAVTNTYAGYGFRGVTNSVGLSMELGVGTLSYVGLYNGGMQSGLGAETTPLSLQSGHPIDVKLTYNGSVLQAHMVDTVTLASFDSGYAVNIPATVGGTQAFVGFVGGSFNQHSSDQYFSNFQFVPSPGGLAAMLGGLGFAARRRR